MQPGAGRSPSEPLLPPDYTNVDLMSVQGVKVSACERARGLLVTILDERKAKLDRQAVVKIHDERKDITSWLTTSRESQLLFCGVEFGTYDLEASAVGYLAERKNLQITPTDQSPQIEIILHKDPLSADISEADTMISLTPAKDLKQRFLL